MTQLMTLSVYMCSLTVSVLLLKSDSSICFVISVFSWKSVLDIDDITYYILPIDCLLIAYRLPLMPICSAIIDMGPGPGPISIMAQHMGIKGNR